MIRPDDLANIARRYVAQHGKRLVSTKGHFGHAPTYLGVNFTNFY
jgi:hypothetical protein